VPAFIDTYDLFLTWYQSRQNTIRAVKENIEDEGESPIDSTDAAKDYFVMFLSKNPIKHYE
jgi:hypothetical protein